MGSIFFKNKSEKIIYEEIIHIDSKKRILVKVPTPAMGDAICATPTIKKISESYGQKIDVMAVRSDIFIGNPNIENILEANSYGLPIGVLADLGVSSFQFDNAKRGFSFRFDNDLDMRMNKDSSLSAYDLLNNYQEKDLENLFTTFGDFKTVESKRLAKCIVAARSNRLLKTTFHLVSSIESLVPQKIRNQFLARVFQAIRIEVNQELTALVDFLNQLPRILKKEGVVSIITYHSLEDRLVKNFFRTGNCNGVLEKDFYGNTSKPFLAINKKPIIPESEEIKMNPRSRSAKLRIAKRI